MTDYHYTIQIYCYNMVSLLPVAFTIYFSYVSCFSVPHCYSGDDVLSEEDEDDTFDVKECFINCQQKFCSVRTICRRLPVTTWLPRYTLADLKGDVIAGVTVALTVIPQGLALAVLAGLPQQYGLYTAFMGCFMYVIFGSCKDLTIGPTAIMSIITSEHVLTGGVTYSVLLTFLCGCIQLMMGLFNLGFLINFIPVPVISGFTSAAAITIAITQLKGIFGLHFSSDGFIDTLHQFYDNFDSTNIGDMTLGFVCVILLIIIRLFKDGKVPEDIAVPYMVRKLLGISWLIIVTARNALLVLICGGISAILKAHDYTPFTLTQDVPPGVPAFQPPAFTYCDNSNNITTHKNFIDICKDLGSGIIIVPLLSLLEAIAVAKAFSKGKKLDATQEMFALGVCNVVGSFVSAYPATGSFSRTAINNNSGVRTPLGGLFTGVIVILALAELAPFFKYIPSAALSAIIFTAVLYMVHYKDVLMMWKTNKPDLLPWGSTFIFSFIFGLEYGIIIGIGTAIIILLYTTARPKVSISIKETSEGIKYILVRPDRALLFPSAESFRSRVTKAFPSSCTSLDDGLNTMVIDGKQLTEIDYTMALMLKNVIESFRKHGVIIIFTHLKPSLTRTILGTQPSVFYYCKSEAQIQDVIKCYTRSKSENVQHVDTRDEDRNGKKTHFICCGSMSTGELEQEFDNDEEP
ncbi:sodium-independent sulfate anion transporter-like isoform X2 [Tachypleus tridentatus]|uniref:sodium-independent sulfate anion transporter-like isoform X2 n=1 Tax=Tachypleus tridentatus TaxID=6853 RepID=UPI003FD129A4